MGWCTTADRASTTVVTLAVLSASPATCSSNTVGIWPKRRAHGPAGLSAETARQQGGDGTSYLPCGRLLQTHGHDRCHAGRGCCLAICTGLVQASKTAQKLIDTATLLIRSRRRRAAPAFLRWNPRGGGRPALCPLARTSRNLHLASPAEWLVALPKPSVSSALPFACRPTAFFSLTRNVSPQTASAPRLSRDYPRPRIACLRESRSRPGEFVISSLSP